MRKKMTLLCYRFLTIAKHSTMNRNTLIAVITICVTINILAAAYVLTNYPGTQAPDATPITSELNLTQGPPSSGELAAVIDKSSAAMAEPDESASAKSTKRNPTRSSKKQEVINHLDKYLNFVPSSNAVTPDGFNKIFFTIVNSSDFTFDEVVINFRCFLSDGTLWNEKVYVVGPIAPHSRAEQLVPNQSRGHSIKWQTVSIKSSDLGFSWPE